MRNKSGTSGEKYTVDLNSLWEERMFGEELPEVDWNRPITHQEVTYLLQLYTYLQVINSEAVWEEEIIPRFRVSASGWTIHDYGQAMSTSPGKYLFGPGNPELREDEEGGEGSGAPNPHGSIVIQSLLTAEDMIEFAIEKGWAGVEIISGTPFMQWAAWIAAQNRDYTLVGYEPTEKERRKRDRIIRLTGQKGVSIGQRIIPGAANK